MTWLEILIYLGYEDVRICIIRLRNMKQDVTPLHVYGEWAELNNERGMEEYDPYYASQEEADAESDEWEQRPDFESNNPYHYINDNDLPF